MIRMSRLTKGILLVLLLMFAAGCSFVFHKRSPEDVRKIDTLETQVSRLSEEVEALERIKRDLENRLKREIERGELDLSVGERGIVIRSLAEVYFDSGKATVRREAKDVLKKISYAVKELGGGRNISVEGHTDDQPIKLSGWKSNQELSEARAKSVADFLVQEGISASSITTKGFADTRPITSNKTAEGRQKNRRVEIIILSRDSSQNFSGRGSETIK